MQLRFASDRRGEAEASGSSRPDGADAGAQPSIAMPLCARRRCRSGASRLPFASVSLARSRKGLQTSREEPGKEEDASASSSREVSPCPPLSAPTRPLGCLLALAGRAGRRGGARASEARLPVASVSSSAGAKDSSSSPSSRSATASPSASSSSSSSASSSSSSSSSPPASEEKPLIDVLAGALARAASQATIHPIDTIKVRMQAPVGSAVPATPAPRTAVGRAAKELGSLYRGVGGAAGGTGLIIGVYFALYSSAKRAIRKHTSLNEGSVAFVAGAAAALGSAVVKVPLAVCVRSVQANVYSNAFVAAREIYKSAGTRGLMTGFVPTILEDVPDTAIKFAAYESLRAVHRRAARRDPSVVEDLVIGGLSGALAAAATTPLDVVKTVMMCSASARPSALSAAKAVWAQGRGVAPFFSGVGPRAISNGLNSAVFFCFFEAIRKTLATNAARRAAGGATGGTKSAGPPAPPAPTPTQTLEAAALEAATAACISAVAIRSGDATASAAAPPPLASLTRAASRLPFASIGGAEWACAPLGAGAAGGSLLLL